MLCVVIGGVGVDVSCGGAVIGGVGVDVSCGGAVLGGVGVDVICGGAVIGDVGVDEFCASGVNCVGFVEVSAFVVVGPKRMSHTFGISPLLRGGITFAWCILGGITLG